MTVRLATTADVDAEHTERVTAFDDAIARVRDAWNAGVNAGHWGCPDCENRTYCAIEGCKK